MNKLKPCPYRINCPDWFEISKGNDICGMLPGCERKKLKEEIEQLKKQALTEDAVDDVMVKLSNQSHEFAGSYCDWVDIDDVKDILMQLVKGEEDE